ncbi:hypothetical protein [Streptomyces geysiriensis]|uniref:hypothetical protein n=1 Tax=Streptomyces geysiriensis TaxID=68207 RepID=UPI00403FF10F
MRRFAAGATRAVCLLAVLAAVGLLPWLSGRDPALTVLRARSAEQEPTEEALSAVRRDLGLDAGPLSLLGDWAAGLVRGDLGTSWVSGTEILPSVLSGLQVSLGLMAAALTVAVLLAVALVAPVLVRGRGSAGAFAAMAAAVPEFLLATVALLVCGVWLGWLPTRAGRGRSTWSCPPSRSVSRRVVCSADSSRTPCPPCWTNDGWSCGGARA